LAAAKRARSRPTRTNRLLGLDGRCILALQMRDLRNGYLSQCVQPVSPIDAALCEQLAMLAGQLFQLNQRALQGPASAADARLLVSLTGAHARLLKQLAGRRTLRPTGPTLDEIFSEGAAA
jgi:hypothetical protein